MRRPEIDSLHQRCILVNLEVERVVEEWHVAGSASYLRRVRPLSARPLTATQIRSDRLSPPQPRHTLGTPPTTSRIVACEQNFLDHYDAPMPKHSKHSKATVYNGVLTCVIIATIYFIMGLCFILVPDHTLVRTVVGRGCGVSVCVRRRARAYLRAWGESHGSTS